MGCCWGREPGGEDAPRRGGRAPTDDLQLIVLVRDRRYGLITDGLQIIIPIDNYLLAERLVRTLLWTALDAWWKLAIHEPRQIASLVGTWQWRFADPAPRIYYNTI